MLSFESKVISFPCSEVFIFDMTPGFALVFVCFSAFVSNKFQNIVIITNKINVKNIVEKDTLEPSSAMDKPTKTKVDA